MELSEKTKGILQIILGILIAGVIFLFSSEFEALEGWGYLGVFVISLLSAATIFFPAPGWAIVIAMGGVLDPLYVGLVAGIGAGIGEMTGYIVGHGAKDAAGNFKELKKYRELIKKHDVLGVFVLALIPNPLFDIAGLAAGALNIKWWKFVIACIVGRALRYVALAYFGAFSLAYL